MNPVLILVDLQYDFLPGGALAVASGDAVIPVANAKMVSAAHVIATQDWHPPGHGSFASSHADVSTGQTFQLSGREQIAWPDHCVQGTRGAELSEELDLSSIGHVVRKGTEPEIDSYSGFFDNDGVRSTGLDQYLRSIDAKDLQVMGLATDYCVLFTVLDALKLGYSVQVDLAGCRGVELHEGDVARAIEAMKQAGATIV